MKISFTRTTCLLLAMALLASQNAMALKVYQWTDEEGVVHYSDTPPQDDAASEINETELVNYEGDDSESDEYSIVNQLERMTAWRRQAEEDRRAWKQLELEEERLALEQQSYQAAPEISTDAHYLPLSYPRIYNPYLFNYPYPVHYPRYMKRHDHHHIPKNHIGMGVGKGFGGGKKGHHVKFTSSLVQFR